jgi:hypothetical protein
MMPTPIRMIITFLSSNGIWNARPLAEAAERRAEGRVVVEPAERRPEDEDADWRLLMLLDITQNRCCHHGIPLNGSEKSKQLDPTGSRSESYSWLNRGLSADSRPSFLGQDTIIQVQNPVRPLRKLEVMGSNDERLVELLAEIDD